MPQPLCCISIKWGIAKSCWRSDGITQCTSIIRTTSDNQKHNWNTRFVMPLLHKMLPSTKQLNRLRGRLYKIHGFPLLIWYRFLMKLLIFSSYVNRNCYKGTNIMLLNQDIIYKKVIIFLVLSSYVILIEQ